MTLPQSPQLEEREGRSSGNSPLGGLLPGF